MVNIVSNDAYNKFRQTQSPSFGSDKDVYAFYDSFSPGASGQGGAFNNFATPTPSVPQVPPPSSGQSFTDTILQSAALTAAGAALSTGALLGGRTSMNPEPWFQALKENAPDAPSSAPNLMKKGTKIIQKAAPKIEDAVNVMNAQLTGSLEAAEAMGGQALQNAEILAAEFGSPGSVPGMLDFGAEMAGMEGTIPTGALEAELVAEASTELAAKNADVIAQEAFAELEAALPTELASEVTPMELTGAFEQEMATKEAAAKGLEVDVDALNIADQSATDFSAGHVPVAGSFGAATVALETQLAGISNIAPSLVGATTAATAANVAGVMAGEMFGTMGVAKAATTAATTAASSAAMATFAAAAPMVIPALIMAIPTFFGGGGGGGRHTWNSLFRVGDDNKISHEVQGVSKFDADFAKLGETWFHDVINNAIDAAGIVWNDDVKGPGAGKKLGDFGWQPGHGQVGTAGIKSPWFINHADLPRGYKGENPGTYFESEHEAAKMWLYINAKAGHMKEGDLQKAFDAVDSFESLWEDRGYKDYTGIKKLTQSAAYNAPWLKGPQKQVIQGDDVNWVSAMDEGPYGTRLVGSKSGLSDVYKQLTKEEHAEEMALREAAVKWKKAHGGRNSRPTVIRETVNSIQVVATHEERPYGEGSEWFDTGKYGKLITVSKLGSQNEYGQGQNRNWEQLKANYVWPETYAKGVSTSTPKVTTKKLPTGGSDVVRIPASIQPTTPPKPKPKPKPAPPKKTAAQIKAEKRTDFMSKNKGKPVPRNLAIIGDLADLGGRRGSGQDTWVAPRMYWKEDQIEGGGKRLIAAPRRTASYENRKGGKIGKSKSSKKKIPTSGLELPVTGGKAKPNSMTDDVPRTARSGDFVINAKTVELMGVPFFRKLIHSALMKANKKGMKLSKTSVSKKEGVDIMVQNGEIRIPRELVKIIGLKKLRAWNNTGLRARGESPIAA